MSKKKPVDTAESTENIPGNMPELPTDTQTEGINTLSIARTPEHVAAEICAIKSQTQAIVLHASVEIGRRLVEAKNMLDHGLWGNWLSVYVDYSQRTATNLMKLYEEYKDKLNQQSLANLTYTRAVLLLGIAPEEREQFAEQNDVENMSTRELQQAIKERDELERKLAIAQDNLTEKAEESRKNLEAKQQLESDARITDRAFKESQSTVKMLQNELTEKRKTAKADVEAVQEVLAETKRQLAEAQSSGNETLVETLQMTLGIAEKNLKQSLDKITELEKQLLEKPIETTAAEIIEKVPAEVEQELSDLKRQVQELQQQPVQQITESEAVLKFRMYFEQLNKGFADILTVLGEIEQTDTERHGKLKNALGKFLGRMTDGLNGEG